MFQPSRVSTMVEVSEIGVKDDEVELDLGLSIGGNFRRSERPIQPDSKPNGFELHAPQHQQQHQAWQGSFEDAKRESMAVVMAPQAKREIHALRRLEAKKKREEKQAQQHKRLVREPEPEPEPEYQRRASKREKTDPRDVIGGGGSECPNANMNLNNCSGQPQQSQGGSHTAIGSMASFSHPYAYVQLNNAYAYPCVVPWMASCAKEKNAGQPAGVCKVFRPFLGKGFRSDPNGEIVCGDNNKKAKSDGSSMCSSSVVSENQSSSHEGGGSSDSHSHSVHSLAEPTQLNSSKEINNNNNNMRSQPDRSGSSHPMGSESDHVNAESKKHTVTQREQTKLKEEQPTMDNKAVEEDNKDTGRKPPKPLPHHTSTPIMAMLPKMPYVSTTGNGPNGKQVNGFLYRYSNSEVSIVCVCHGSTFSAAGFVQHAGGTDTAHPERHITVIPPAFG